jgi:hypothetical protein
MNKSDITEGKLREALTRLGYAFFENGDYNLNIIGVRTGDESSNRFNDFIALAYKANGEWNLDTFEVTTDPGLYWLNHPMNLKGTAILAADQHKGCYKLGLHQGKYTALVQAKAVPVYRDRNLDNVVDDRGKLDTGFHGINIHRASSKHQSKQVDRWSAGCQVFADPFDFGSFIKLCEKSASLYGSRFTYTLIEEKDLQ